MPHGPDLAAGAQRRRRGAAAFLGAAGSRDDRVRDLLLVECYSAALDVGPCGSMELAPGADRVLQGITVEDLGPVAVDGRVATRVEVDQPDRLGTEPILSVVSVVITDLMTVASSPSPTFR